MQYQFALGVVPVIVVLSLFFAQLTFDETMSTEALLDRLRERDARLQNLSVTAVWNELEAGKQIARSIETIAFDSYGRIRVDASVFEHQSQVRASSEVYDGENIFSITEDQSRDRDGAAVDANKKKNGIYQRAIINPGQTGHRPTATRNPVKFVGISLEQDLQNLLNHGLNATITLVDRSSGTYRIEYDLPLDATSNSIKCIATIEGQKHWMVSKFEKIARSSNTAIQLQENSLSIDEHGNWFPKQGFLRSFSGDQVAMEWRFETQSISIRHDQLDDAVFQIRLKPDTFVTDNRFDVNYWIGATGAVGNDLAALANAALAENTAELQRHQSAISTSKSSRLTSSERQNGLNIFLLLNVVAIAALMCFWTIRRRIT